MNKIIIVPDVHGRTFWKDIKDIKNCSIIFLGDYLDPYSYEFDNLTDRKLSEQTIDNFKEIIEFAKSNNNAHLLLGNHDCHYIGISHDECRLDFTNFKTIQSIFNENKSLFNIAYQENNILFTHAGITNKWIKYHNIDTDNIVDYLNDMVQTCNWTDISNTPLSSVGFARGGTCFSGSPIWADAGELIYDSAYPDLIQIVGHSQLKNTGDFIHRKNIYCIDSRSCFIYENEKIKKWK